jgi:hypothetical protein
MPAIVVAPESAPPAALREHGPPPVRPAAFSALPIRHSFKTPGLPATAIEHAIPSDAVSYQLSEVFGALPNLIRDVGSAWNIHPSGRTGQALSDVLNSLKCLLATFHEIEDRTDAYHAFRVYHPEYRAGKLLVVRALSPERLPGPDDAAVEAIRLKLKERAERDGVPKKPEDHNERIQVIRTKIEVARARKICDKLTVGHFRADASLLNKPRTECLTAWILLLHLETGMKPGGACTTRGLWWTEHKSRLRLLPRRFERYWSIIVATLAVLNGRRRPTACFASWTLGSLISRHGKTGTRSSSNTYVRHPAKQTMLIQCEGQVSRSL